MLEDHVGRRSETCGSIRLGARLQQAAVFHLPYSIAQSTDRDRQTATQVSILARSTPTLHSTARVHT